MPRSIAEKGKNTLRWLAGIAAILLGVAMLFRPVYAQTGLEYLYDLPDQALIQHLDEYEVSIAASDTMEQQLSAKLYALTGCMKAEEFRLSLAERQTFALNTRTYLGALKVAAVSDSGAVTVAACEDTALLTLEAGSYDLYYVGDHFVGSLRMTPNEEDVS